MKLSSKMEKQSNLTCREKEILLLLFEGLTSKQISQKLFVSEATVITHRKNLRKKLKVTNSIELINQAMKMGLI
jgi:DNA-binding NarL/FixJ family response regulator